MATTDHTLRKVQQAHAEWTAWQAVVRELAARGIDVNGADRLVAAVTWWGEELVRLRAMQQPEVVHRAYRNRALAARVSGVDTDGTS